MKRVALVLLALTTLTGCAKIREKLGQKDKNVPTAAVGTDAKLPDGWPSDVPAYPDAKITASMASPQGKTAVFQTKDSPVKITDFYKAKLGSFSKLNDIDAAGTRQVVYKDGKRTIQIVAAPAGDKTNLTVSVAGG